MLHLLQDGAVTNLQETIDALVKASDIPISILIVGVGNADFSGMEVYFFPRIYILVSMAELCFDECGKNIVFVICRY